MATGHYEYTAIRGENEYPIKTLNELARDGWEVTDIEKFNSETGLSYEVKLLLRRIIWSEKCKCERCAIGGGTLNCAGIKKLDTK